MLRASIMLAALPVIVFTIMGTGKSKAPIAPKPVQTEGVRMVRMDDATFRRRWAPLSDLPPATEVRYARKEVADAVSGAVKIAPQPVPSSRHRLRSRPARLDVCARHHMRKVMVGKYRWRCRK